MDRREQIKEIMRAKNITSVRHLARMIGMTEGTLNNQMAGNRSVSLETIEAILNTFDDVSADWLLRGKGGMITAPAEKTGFIDTFLKGLCTSGKSELDEYQRVLTSVRNLRNLESKQQ